MYFTYPWVNVKNKTMTIYINIQYLYNNDNLFIKKTYLKSITTLLEEKSQVYIR